LKPYSSSSSSSSPPHPPPSETETNTNANKQVLTLIRAQLAPEARDQLLLLLRLLRARAAAPLLMPPSVCVSLRRRPFVRTFEELSVRGRERVLLAWQRSPAAPLRLAFKGLKSLVAGTVLTSVTGGSGAGAAAPAAAGGATGGGGAAVPVAASPASLAAGAGPHANGGSSNSGVATPPPPKSNPFWAGMGYAPERFVGAVPPAHLARTASDAAYAAAAAAAAAAADAAVTATAAAAAAKRNPRRGFFGRRPAAPPPPPPPPRPRPQQPRQQPAVYAATLAAEEILASAVLDGPRAAREARSAAAAAAGPSGGGNHNGSNNNNSASAHLAERLARARFSVVEDPPTSALAPAAAARSSVPTATIEADAVVVGSGAGGAVAAALLARAGLRVVVVEKGPWRRASDMSPYEGESMRTMYERAGFVSTRDGGVSILAGATLGGGTKINWCASLRTPDHVRAEWAAAPHGLGEALSGAPFDAALDAVCERLLGAGWRLDGQGGGGAAGASAGAAGNGGGGGGCSGGAAGPEVEDANNRCRGPSTTASPAAVRVRPGASHWTTAGAPGPAPAPAPASDPILLEHFLSKWGGLPHPPPHTTEKAGSNGVLWDGLAALGAGPRELPRNCASVTCSAACAFGCAPGNKASADVSWLADAARAGALVLARCEARRVLLEAGGGRPAGAAAAAADTAGPAARPQGRVAGVEIEVTGAEDGADDGPWAPADAPAPLLARLVVRAPVVFAAAGSLHTPALLLRSGVTGGGAVGRNLRLHPASGVVARFASWAGGGAESAADAAAAAQGDDDGCPVPLTFASAPQVDMYKGAMMAVYSTFAARWPSPAAGAGAAASAAGEGGGGGGGKGGAGAADKQRPDQQNDGYGAMVSVPVAHPGMLGATCQWESGRAFKRTLLPAPDLALFLVFARDGGAGGRVRLGRDGRPAVDYWPRARDRRSMLDGIELAVRAAVAAGASEVFLPHNTLGRLNLTAPALVRPKDWAARSPNPSPPEDAALFDAALRADARALERYVAKLRAPPGAVAKYELAVLSAHQMGSARMGAKRGASAFDPRGESWDARGLYVADASAFPTPSGVNPMVTVQALAHVVASGVAAREGPRVRRERERAAAA